ncbi:MAG: signal peptidase I [Bacillota bacterium]
MSEWKKARVELYPKSCFRENLESIAIAITFTVFVMIFVLQACMVDGHSMEPTLHDRERLFVDKITYQILPLKTGDIVVFHPPLETKNRFIKRVIGTPGNYVEIKNGDVYINGKPLHEPYLKDQDFLPGNYASQVIPADKYLVLGDNRNNSNDGRWFGLIGKKAIVGRAVFVFWPFSRMGFIKYPHYYRTGD